MRRAFTLAVLLSLVATAPTPGQTVYGSDGVGALTWELTMPPAGPCVAPNPVLIPCPNAFLICPLVPPLTPMPGTLLGDIADDPIADVVYVTDGRVVAVHAGDPPCATFPCTPLDAFFVPAIPGMGPVTGMGCDSSGTFVAGAPLLWITDGTVLAGIVPPLLGSCGVASVAFPPCALPAAVVPATDVSWDPTGGLLWVVSALGVAQAFTAPTCAPASLPVTIAACGLAPPFMGLAYDTSTPNFTGVGPAAYVTDGVGIAYVDLTTGGPAGPTFATPVPCTVAPGPLNGLAHSHHGINYGFNRVIARLGSFGQSTSPGPSFGLEFSGIPPGVPAYLVVNTNFPGPGFFCPGLTGVGTTWWVDPTPPGQIIPLGPLPGPGCLGIPVPLGPGLPPGLELYLQVIYYAGGPSAVDASEGLAITIGLP